MSGDAPWYRLLDHTGDVAVLVRAPTLESLYDAATRALFDVILDVRTVRPDRRVRVRVDDALDTEDLLVRYLSRLLFEHDARRWVFRGAVVRRITSRSVDAEALGEPFDPHRHSVEREVKAVTYHHLLVSEDRQGWSARLVLDL